MMKHTLVFLHGFPFNQSMWTDQVAFAQAQFNVIAYDQRGHGQGELGAGQYAFENFVDDLLNLLDARGVQKAILCGLSMGGYVALRAIERAPERISGLILCDTRSEADSNEAKLKRAATVKTIKDQGVSIFCEDFLKSVLTPETLASRPDIATRVRHMIMGNNPLGIIGTTLAMAGRTDTTESLSRIKVPTLILVGDKDPITPPSAAQAMHERISGSIMAVIANASHMSNLENPKAFNQHLGEFLKTYN
jgi:3-oxoadipate enol-lactonase